MRRYPLNFRLAGLGDGGPNDYAPQDVDVYGNPVTAWAGGVDGNVYHFNQAGDPVTIVRDSGDQNLPVIYQDAPAYRNVPGPINVYYAPGDLDPVADQPGKPVILAPAAVQPIVIPDSIDTGGYVTTMPVTATQNPPPIPVAAPAINPADYTDGRFSIGPFDPPTGPVPSVAVTVPIPAPSVTAPITPTTPTPTGNGGTPSWIGTGGGGGVFIPDSGGSGGAGGGTANNSKSAMLLAGLALLAVLMQ